MKKTLFIFLLACISVVNVFAQITDDQNTDTYKTGDITTIDGKEYMVHIVQPKQTMYAISKKYDIPLQDLYTINPESRQGVSIDQMIYIPLQINMPEEKMKAGTYIFHSVRPGETLYNISHIYDVSIESIKLSNPTLTSDALPVDFNLRIPYSLKTEKKKAEDAVEPKKEIQKPTIQKTIKQANKPIQKEDSLHIYTVKARETLYGVSKKFNTTVEALIVLNPELMNGLKFGQRIRIPSSDFQPSPDKIAELQDQVYPYRDSLYIYHKVKQGDNLYQLARFYAVSIDTLKTLNPTLGNDIYINQIIRFPLSDIVPGFIVHTADKNEKVKKIAKRYDVDVESLEMLNPHLARKIRIGESIRIPLEKRHVDYEAIYSVVETAESEEEIEGEDTANSFEGICKKEELKGKHIQLALMLPFYLDKVKSNTFSNINEFSKVSDYRSLRYISFYEGAMLAIDSLSKLGINIDIHVYNISNDLEETRQHLSQPEMRDMDLIIGILFTKNFKLVANFAQQNAIPLINAISRRPEIIDGNPWVFKVEPSEESSVKEAVNMLPTFKDSLYNVFIIRNNKYKHSGMVLNLKNKINAWSNDDFGYKKNYHEVIYMQDSIDGFINQADTLKKNIVFAVTENDIFVLQVLRELNELKDTFDIKVIGLPYWEDIKNVQTDYLQNLNVVIPSASYYDYSTEAMQRFNMAYRARYNTEPDELAIKGYDFTYFFTFASAAFGHDFRSCVNNLPVELLHTRLKFRHQHGNGYENTYWNAYEVIHYKKINLKKYSEKDFDQFEN